MNIVQHSTNNGVAAAPRGMDIEICKAAPYTAIVDPHLGLSIQTFWRPCKEELEALNDGGLVMLTVASTMIHPHRIEVTKEL